MMPRKRILIVDDDVAGARLLKLNLEQTNNYEVRVEYWPEDALESAQAFQPDLVILDVMMPRMFGGDVAARFQTDPALKEVPIVFFTAAVGKTRVADHEGIIGEFAFLSKAADMRTLINCIGIHLSLP